MILVKTKQDVTKNRNGFVVFIIYFKIEKFLTYKEKNMADVMFAKLRVISAVSRLLLGQLNFGYYLEITNKSI